MGAAAIPLLIAGTAVSAVGQISAANASARASEFNANVALQQAASEREVAKASAADYRREESAKLALARALQGASGFTSEGTPLMVEEETVRQAALGSARIIHGGELRATRYEDEAKLSKMRASAERTAGRIGAVSTILTGVGSAYA